MGLRVNRSSARDAEATLGLIDREHYRTFTEERVGLALLLPHLAAAILGFLDARNADSMSQIQTMRRVQTLRSCSIGDFYLACRLRFVEHVFLAVTAADAEVGGSTNKKHR